MTDTLWSPTADRIDRSALREYLNWLEVRERRPFPDHDALWAWSVEDLDRFWSSIADYYKVEFSTPWTTVRTADPMPHARWFSGARLNWAQHALRHGADDATALVCVQEGGGPAREITRAALRRSVAAAAAWLRRAGVRPGDRIAAYLPNTEHAVIGCLAAAAIGAVWACCSPDFGADGTIGRLAQLEPSVLIAADGYHWNGKVIDRSDVVAQLRDKLPALERFVHVPYAFSGRPHPEGSTAWDEVLAQDEPLVFEQVEFSHPLWVLFSSGTTGLPKGLVHGQGGITLEGDEMVRAVLRTACWRTYVHLFVHRLGVVEHATGRAHPGCEHRAVRRKSQPPEGRGLGGRGTHPGGRHAYGRRRSDRFGERRGLAPAGA